MGKVVGERKDQRVQLGALEAKMATPGLEFPGPLFPTLTKRCHKEVACNKVSCIGLAGPMLCGINHFLFGLVVCSNYVHIHTYVMYVYMCVYIYTYICIYIVAALCRVTSHASNSKKEASAKNDKDIIVT